MKEVSILEQSVSVEGKPQSVTIQDSINLAKTAEKLGYKLVDHKLELYGSKIKK